MGCSTTAWQDGVFVSSPACFFFFFHYTLSQFYSFLLQSILASVSIAVSSEHLTDKLIDVASRIPQNIFFFFFFCFLSNECISFPPVFSVSLFRPSYSRSPPFFLFLSLHSDLITFFCFYRPISWDRLSEQGAGWDEVEKAGTGEQEQENYPSLSSRYSKHFTGNCCRHTTDRQKGYQANTHTHTHTNSQCLYCYIAETSGWHQWIEEHKALQEHSEVSLSFLSHGWHLSD